LWSFDENLQNLSYTQFCLNYWLMIFYRFISTCHFSSSHLLNISLRVFSRHLLYVSIEVCLCVYFELVVILPDTWTCSQRFWYQTFQIVWQCSDSYVTMWLRLLVLWKTIIDTYIWLIKIQHIYRLVYLYVILLHVFKKLIFMRCFNVFVFDYSVLLLIIFHYM
jgi:hypothetical protein